ncbi:hypothetical protein G9A89_023273 [Geosiphon pyriformis]|nr:hypothetical protein G9A89_023273 [Geosiphon pyriformis]
MEDSRNIDTLAFKVQFDEVKQAVAKFLEYNKSNNFNRFHALPSPSLSAPLPLRQSILHPHNSQRPLSQPAFFSSTPRQRVLKHQRSTPNLSGTHSHLQFSHQRSSSTLAPISSDYIHEATLPPDFPNEKHFTIGPGVNRNFNKSDSNHGLADSTLHSGHFFPWQLASSSLAHNDAFISHTGASYKPSRFLEYDKLLQKQRELHLKQLELDKAIDAHNQQLRNQPNFSIVDSTNTIPSSISNPPDFSTRQFPMFGNVPINKKTQSLERKQSLQNILIDSIGTNSNLSIQEPIGTPIVTPVRKSGQSTPASFSGSNASHTLTFSLFALSPTISLNQNIASSCSPKIALNDDILNFSSFSASSNTSPKEKDIAFSSSYLTSQKRENCYPQEQTQLSFDRSSLVPLIASQVQQSPKEGLWNGRASFDNEYNNQEMSYSPAQDNEFNFYGETAILPNGFSRERQIPTQDHFARRSGKVHQTFMESKNKLSQNMDSLKDLRQRIDSVIDHGTKDENLLDCIEQWCDEYQIKPEELFQEILEIAPNNSEYAFLLGFTYHHGFGTDMDLKSMIFWYKISAESGDHLGETQLGWCHSQAFGTGRDFTKAFYWHLKSALGGNFIGACNLAYCYLWGIGTVENKRKAWIWYKIAAEYGICTAQTEIARSFQFSIGINKDLHTALRWYRKAANAGDFYSEKMLCMLLKKL